MVEQEVTRRGHLKNQKKKITKMWYKENKVSDLSRR